MSEPMRAVEQTISHSATGYQLSHVTPEDGFSASQQTWLKDGLIKAFPDLKMVEYFAAKTNWFNEYDHLIYCVEDISGDIVGLLAARWLELAATDNSPPVWFVQATTQFIAPHWQGTSMLRNIWGKFLSLIKCSKRGFPELFVLKTCNPLAFRPMHTFARIPGIEVYPKINGSPQAHAMAVTANRIADLICPDQQFDVDTGVISDISRPLDFYPQLPEGKPGSLISYYFHSHLTCADRLLCITHLKTERARSIVLNAFSAKAS